MRRTCCWRATCSRSFDACFLIASIQERKERMEMNLATVTVSLSQHRSKNKLYQNAISIHSFIRLWIWILPRKTCLFPKQFYFIWKNKRETETEKIIHFLIHFLIKSTKCFLFFFFFFNKMYLLKVKEDR